MPPEIAAFFAALWEGIKNNLAPLVTFFVALIALFKEDFVKRWRRPELTVRLSLKAPDAHCIRSVVGWQGPDDPKPNRWEGPIYYFRLWVENESTWGAERVQVYVKTIHNRLGDNRLQEVRDWLPMNLRWSNSPFDKPILFETLNPLMGKHCDLGSVSHPSNPAEQPLAGMREGESTFNLASEVFPNSSCHRLAPGKYRLDVLVAAQNAKPKRFSVDLDWNGIFEDSAERMFSNSIAISVSSGKS